MKFNKKLATAALTGLIAAGGLAACAADGDKDHNSCSANGCKGKAAKSENSCDANSCSANGCAGK